MSRTTVDGNVPSNVNPSSSSETLLLVDDDERVRAFVRVVLRKRGYRVLEATNGEEALRSAERVHSRIDMILTDVVMPGMHGRTLADKMTILHPETKVLFMSGYTDSQVLRQNPSGPQIPLIQKPFTPEELLRRVREVLNG